MEYRDEIYFEAQPEREVSFSEEEFAGRLTRIRKAMAESGIDCLFLSSPESMYYVSGYVCMWYHTESPMEGVRRIPDTGAKAAALLSLMAGNKAVDQLIDRDRTEGLIQLELSTRTAAETETVLAAVEAHVGARPATVQVVDQVAARVGALCVIYDVACPPADALVPHLRAEPGVVAAAEIAAALVVFMGTGEFLAALPPEPPGASQRLAEAVAALGPEADGDGIAQAAATALELQPGDPTIDDVVFSLETPITEIWTRARVSKAAGTFVADLKLTVPDGGRGDRFLRTLAGALSELDRAEPTSPPELDLAVSGLPVLYRGLERSVQANQYKSLALALLLVVVILSIVFRSVTSGLLASTPTVLTLLAVYGAMGALGVHLDIGTSMLASLIIGAGVDYAVHMVAAWRVPAGAAIDVGAQHAARSTASAIWTNAMMVAAGFFVLTLGDARPLQNVGLLTASAMIVAAASTFVAVPILARKRSYSAAAVLAALDHAAPGGGQGESR